MRHAFDSGDHGPGPAEIDLHAARRPLQLGEAVRLHAMLPPPALDPAPHRRIRAREPALRHEPLVHARRGVALLDGHARIRGRPPVHDGRIPRVDQRPARMPRAKGLGRVIPVAGVLDHGRARYAEFPRYLPVAQALAVELPDTPSDTHRCRHFLSSREPSVWLTGTRESIKEPDDAGVLIPPAPSPPIPSKLNAQSVQEQVPTVNTFIRSHTQARGILGIHADSLMAVYGCRKTHARPSARGRDPAEIGRDQVTNVMRESGIRGVRRGRTPVTTKPAKGTGGRPDLVERRFEAEAPNRLHVADITYVRMANGSFGYTAFVTDVFARRIVGWACATTMDTRELPLQALEQAISWAASHGGTDGLVHHSDHGAQYISLVYTTRVGEFGMLPSTGTVGDSYDNAMAESVNGAYKTELVWRRKPFQDLRDLELATFRWVSWWNSKRLHQSLGYRTPERTETEYYANQAAQAAPL